MRRFANGSVLYDDSPWFIEIALFLFAAGLAAVARKLWTHIPPNYLVVGVLSLFIVICIAGMFSQQRRRFFFNPSASTMLWSVIGLFGRSNGEVAFKDISVGIDSSTNDDVPTYRVMLTSPAGPMPLTQAYTSGLPSVERRANELRVILGQSTTSAQADR